MTLSLHGAAGCVTGSCFRLQTEHACVLIDCASGRDYSPDPEGPAGVDHVILEPTYGNRERPVIDPVTRRRMLTEELRLAQAVGGRARFLCNLDAMLEKATTEAERRALLARLAQDLAT